MDIRFVGSIMVTTGAMSVDSYRFDMTMVTWTFSGELQIAVKFPMPLEFANTSIQAFRAEVEFGSA